MKTEKIGWKEVEFGNSEYFKVKKGESITKDKASEGKIPVIAGGQQPAYYHNKSNRHGKTITISGSGAYAGFVNYFTEPIFASDCSTIQSKKELISTKYAYLFLKSYQKKIYSLQKGIAQPHVYPKDIIKIKIPIPFSNGTPNLKEQERIVSILEKAESLKLKGKSIEDLLDEYLNSVFYEKFYNQGYENKTLKQICIKITDGTHKTPKYINKGIPFLRVTDLTNSNDSKKFISLEEHEELIKRCKPEKMDILYSKNGTIGVAKTIDWDYEFSIFVSLCLIKPNSKLILSKFLEFFLNTPFALNQAFQHSKKGTIINLHLNEINKMFVPLPPLQLQYRFTKIVEQVEKMKENVKKTKQNSEYLFNSLMQKAFRGEL